VENAKLLMKAMKYKINDSYRIEIFAMVGETWKFWIDHLEGGVRDRYYWMCAHTGKCMWNAYLADGKSIPLDVQKEIELLVSRLWKMRAFV
jgi:hypothetical protein